MATVAKTVEVRSSHSLAGAKVREALVGYGFILLPMTIFALWYLYPPAYAIYILNADGLLNKIVGGHTPWFGQASTALWSIMGLNIWTTSGTIMLFYLAALQAIPNDVYEAAAVDGTGSWRTFWRITFPLLKPGHFFVAVVSVIGCLKLFDQSFIVSSGT